MSIIEEQIQKARRRLEGIDPHELVAQTRDKSPIDLSSASVRAARRNFLRESLTDNAGAQSTFPDIRIINIIGSMRSIDYRQTASFDLRESSRIELIPD